ncbi:hypothetical protein J6590_077819 [Homalodisca vitripennis]|nr:hypothetical protein J6590_077819 [Homalodisca vitripennis]
MEKQPTRVINLWLSFEECFLVTWFHVSAISIGQGHLKFKVYRRKPRSLEELKVAISEEIAAVSQDTLD